MNRDEMAFEILKMFLSGRHLEDWGVAVDASFYTADCFIKKSKSAGKAGRS